MIEICTSHRNPKLPLVWKQKTLFYARRINSRDMLYNIVPVVNSIISYTAKFITRVELMLSATTIKNKTGEWDRQSI